MIGSSAAWRWTSRQHHVGLGTGEEPAAGDGRKLRRVAEDEHGLAEREEVVADLLVDHRAFVDDDHRRLGGGAVAVEDEARPDLVLAAHAVDQAVDGAGVRAALAAHDVGGLAGEGGEDDAAVGALRDMAGKRRLAGAGIAEKPEDRAVAGLEPGPDGGQCILLLADQRIVAV